jgi:hypothetical protein
MAVNERRSDVRLPLRCVLRLYRTAADECVECETENLSVDGFYCLSDEPFAPGERLNSTLILPVACSGDPLYLNCCVQVLRVEVRQTAPSFGIACRIESYWLGKTDHESP